MCDGRKRQVRLLAHLDQLEAAGVQCFISQADGPGMPAVNDWPARFCIIPPDGMTEFVDRVMSDDDYYADLYEAARVRLMGYGWWVKVGSDEIDF